MAGYGGIPGDTGRYREIPGDTRGYDEIRSAHDVHSRPRARERAAPTCVSGCMCQLVCQAQGFVCLLQRNSPFQSFLFCSEAERGGQDTAGYRGISRDMAGYGGIWRDTVRYGEIHQDTAKEPSTPGLLDPAAGKRWRHRRPHRLAWSPSGDPSTQRPLQQWGRRRWWRLAR